MISRLRYSSKGARPFAICQQGNLCRICASLVSSGPDSPVAEGSGPLDQDELEELLYDGMDESFNADIEDGSVEEVTKHLMIMYTRCLRQNYSYIDKLRKTRLAGSAITQRKEVLGGYDSSSDDDENPRSEEDDDEAGPNPKPPKPVPDADGWTTVTSRRRSK